jgi:hypothetical protein
MYWKEKKATDSFSSTAIGAKDQESSFGGAAIQGIRNKVDGDNRKAGDKTTIS